VILQRISNNMAVVTTVALMLLGLPATGACQGEPAPAEQQPGVMEEVIVWGSKSLIDLKLEMIEAEDTLFELFNSFNTNDEFDVHCYREAPVGSRIKQRVCRTNIQRRLLRSASQRMMAGEPYVFPATEIKHAEKRLLENMTETALEQPEMLKALMQATEARKALESERERRCEGKFLFCW
jgi:hypothetical protein